MIPTDITLLKHLDTYLRQSQALNSLSLAELELDKLIIKEVRTKNGTCLFDDTTSYLTKITQGNLYLKRYAKQTHELQSYLQNVTVQDRTVIQNIRKNLTRTTNETHSIIKLVKKANFLIPIPINLSEARWNPPNISINFTSEDITPEDITDNLLKGLGVVPNVVGNLVWDGMNEVSNVVGSGIEHLLKPLLPILIPIACITLCFIVLCCIIQLHPKCKNVKKTLTPPFLQAEKKDARTKMHIEDMLNPPKKLQRKEQLLLSPEY